MVIADDYSNLRHFGVVIILRSMTDEMDTPDNGIAMCQA
jgi:hypothetical protein